VTRGVEIRSPPHTPECGRYLMLKLFQPYTIACCLTSATQHSSLPRRHLYDTPHSYQRVRPNDHSGERTFCDVHDPTLIQASGALPPEIYTLSYGGLSESEGQRQRGIACLCCGPLCLIVIVVVGAHRVQWRSDAFSWQYLYLVFRCERVVHLCGYLYSPTYYIPSSTSEIFQRLSYQSCPCPTAV